MVHSELDDARAALETAAHKSRRGRRKRIGIPSESLHDARVALKRTRALARLAEPAVGRAAQQADRALRAVARKLGPIRDGQVLLLTFDRLRTHARARSAGVPDSRGAGPSASGPGGAATAGRGDALDRCRPGPGGEARPRAPTGGTLGAQGWRTLAPGLSEAYRRCRRRMRAAYARKTPAAFHAWRRVSRPIATRCRRWSRSGPRTSARGRAIWKRSATCWARSMTWHCWPTPCAKNSSVLETTGRAAYCSRRSRAGNASCARWRARWGSDCSPRSRKIWTHRLRAYFRAFVASRRGTAAA